MKLIETAVAFALLLGCGNSALLAIDTPSAKHIRTFGELGQDVGQFNAPLGMIVDSRDRLIIADAQNNRIQICDEFGKCRSFGSRGTASGKFRNPHGVAVDAQDRIYTVETHTNRVQIFSPEGELLGGFGEWGSCLGCFSLPGDVAIDNRGRILVADERNYRVQTCTQAGVCASFGSKGSLPGNFDWPRAIVVDQEDRIFVADRFNGRVQICNEQGICSVMGSEGSEVGQFDGPVELDLDLEGNLVVADRENHRVQVCGIQGDCWAFGTFGTGPGQFNHPLGVAVDSKGRIFVADSENHRIQLFEVVRQGGINRGHAGAWFWPTSSGQGLFIDVEPETQFISIGWFTYTEAGSDHPNEQRWYTAQGNYVGNTAVLDLHETLGGGLNDPQEVVTTKVGTVILEFDDCESGMMSYDFDAGDPVSDLPLVRVIPGSENLCEDLEGASRQTVGINQGMDGAWYDPDTSGQGFYFDIHTDSESEKFIFVSWFTYGNYTASGQRWLTAQGNFEGSVAIIDVHETTGGSFDDPQEVETMKVGTMTIDFADCETGVLSYLLDEGLEGAIDITRLVPGAQQLCEEFAGLE